ncbi:MAG: sodium:solute symporter family transporter, partial [Planctomycetota bacterium]
LFLPAVALSTVTGLDVYACIALMGVLAIAYTVLGGVEAVIWTDVLQVAVLASGAGLILYTLAVHVDFGAAGIVAAGLQHEKFRTFQWGWSYTQGVVWVMVAGSLFSAMMPNTADQSVVQRYLATKDERQARQAAWTSALLGIPTGLVFFFMGTALFAFYTVYKVAELPENIENIAILPHFVMRQMPAGVSGLVIAGIFAAAMSTVDNGMNAIATAGTTDFYRRLRAGRSEREYLWAARAVTLAAGLVATGTAMVVCSLEIDSMLKFFFRLMNLFGGSLAGLFVLGIFTRRANGWGAMIGAVASAAATYTVKVCTPVHFMLHAGVGLGVCVGVGYLASLAVPGGKPRQEGLTIHTVSRASGK